MVYIWFMAVFALAYAGSAPYLGQDIDELKEETKRSGITQPIVNRPITEQQKYDYNRYNQKFTDIAKAYAEGYKAAIKAVQARAMIAQKRIQANRNVNTYQMNRQVPRSLIPAPPSNEITPPAVSNNAYFNQPVPNEITVNGMEKSGIPRPNDIPFQSFAGLSPVGGAPEEDHKVVERSAPFYAAENTPDKKEHTHGFANVPLHLISEKARNEITKLNYAARHRNVYFDIPGGATRQNVIFQKKHRRRRRSLERQRRSRMPYLGQNLDAMGVVRAQINWNARPKKKTETPQAPSEQMAQENGNSLKPEQSNPLETNYARSNISPELTYGYTYQYPNQQGMQQQKSNVPNGQFQMTAPLMYPSQYYAGFIPNDGAIENIDYQPTGTEKAQ